MSLAIKFGDENIEGSVSGAIYFDAVTSYTRNLGGKVSEHPLEAGAYISDHYFSQQPVYNVSGIISHIDFTSSPVYNPNVKIDGFEITNRNKLPGNVSITDNTSFMDKFLPDFIQQFRESTPLEIKGDESERTNHAEKIYQMIKTLLSGVYFNEERGVWENRMTLVTMFEMDGISPTNPVPNLVLTKFTTKETPTSSGALIFDLELREIEFVESKKTEAPKTRPKSVTSRKTSPKDDKGNCVPDGASSTENVDKVSKNVNFGEISRKSNPGVR